MLYFLEAALAVAVVEFKKFYSFKSSGMEWGFAGWGDGDGGEGGYTNQKDFMIQLYRDIPYLKPLTQIQFCFIAIHP